MKAELQQEVVTKKPKKTGKSKGSTDVLPQPNTTTTTTIPERDKKYQSEYIAIVLGIMLVIQALTIDVIADQPQGT